MWRKHKKALIAKMERLDLPTTNIYSVKLTISDGTNGFALEKKDYIYSSVND